MGYSNFYPSSGMFHASLPMLMGTRIDVLLFGDNSSQLENVWECMEMELRRFEKLLNRFDPESEVANINKYAHFSKFNLSDELWDIMLDCRQYYEKTDGFFDITHSNFEKIVFFDKTHDILLDKYGMILDFGGYAKGYALKYVRKALREAGVERALVNFGNSSVLALGAHPYSDSWPICLDDLSIINGQSSFLLNDASLSVSGNTSSLKPHIFNPKTGELIGGAKLVAIVAEDPLDAEVLTTAWIASDYHHKPEWMLTFNLINTYRIK